MVYGFVKQSGGQMKVDSEEGVGARVYLRLPVEAAQAEAVEQTAPETDVDLNFSRETVLVVDDEPSVRIFVNEALGSLGYRVIEAADGLTGLQLLQSDTPIDLLVTDIGLLGGIDGRRMADSARKCRPHLSVLFMTEYAEPPS